MYRDGMQKRGRDDAWGNVPQFYHDWQFMVVASFSGHFLLSHGLGTRLV